jgi:hypothetical protein
VSGGARADPPAVTRTTWIVLALVSVAFLVAGGWFYREYWPFLRWPERPVAEIRGRWEQVERWAALPAADPEGQDRLAAVFAKVAALELPAALSDPDEEELPQEIDPASIPDGYREALRDLISWHDGGRGGGWSWSLERDGAWVTAPFDLARVALALDDGESVPALAHLFAQARRSGSLFDYLLGATLADDLVDWLAEHPAARPALERYRPRRDEVFPAFARDAVLMRAELAKSLRAEGEAPEDWWTARELVVATDVFADRLFRAHPVRDDLAALSAALEVPLEEWRARSVLVPMLISRLPDPESIEAKIRRWDALYDDGR